MAPSAMADAAPMQLPAYSKYSNKVNASVLHGPRDLRLVSYVIRHHFTIALLDILCLVTPARIFD